jgi:hypothetical protein
MVGQCTEQPNTPLELTPLCGPKIVWILTSGSSSTVFLI